MVRLEFCRQDKFYGEFLDKKWGQICFRHKKKIKTGESRITTNTIKSYTFSSFNILMSKIYFLKTSTALSIKHLHLKNYIKLSYSQSTSSPKPPSSAQPPTPPFSGICWTQTMIHSHPPDSTIPCCPLIYWIPVYSLSGCLSWL